MFIDGIKVIPSDASEAKVWRFRNEQGAYKHLCALACARQDQDLLRGALAFALFGTRATQVRHALVALTDDNGDAWIFERSEEQARCLKNRQLVDTKNDKHLKELFADYIPFEGEVSWGSMLRVLDISADGEGLVASGMKNGKRSPWEQLSVERAEGLQKSIRKFWGEVPDLRLGMKFLPIGEGFLKRRATLDEHAKDVAKVFQQIETIDPVLLRKFDQELEIVTQIRYCCEPLSVPSRNPKLLTDRLAEVEKEIEAIKDDLSKAQLFIPELDCDWSMVMQALTRFLGCDRLEKAARSSLQDARERLRPVYDSYRQQIAAFLEHDRDLIRGLEVSLQELDAHVQRNGERQRPNLSNKLNKLLGFQPGDATPSVDAEEGLGRARAIVNRCLTEIARLYAELEGQSSLHEQKLADFEARYEQIAKEYNRAREHWATVAKECGLPADIGLRQLMGALNQYSRLSVLQQKRSRCVEELQEHRGQLRQLAALLESWRTHTGSQKSLPLENPNVILAEARGVLAYADKKEGQWKKLKALESQLEAYRNIKGRIKADADRLDQLWRQALAEVSLPYISLDADGWDACLRELRELAMIEGLREQAYQPLRNEKIFAEAVFDVPFVLYSWKDATLGNKARLQLLQQIEQTSPFGWALILCEDQTLVEMMQKMGLSHGARLTPKVQGKASEKAPEAARADIAKPLISDKARSALEVFAAKQGSPRRGEL